MHSIVSGVEFILRGGFMMFPLLISAVIALTVIIERLFVFQRVYRTSPEDISKVLQQIRSQQLNQASEVCQKFQTPVTSVISAGIEHFENPLEEMELSMKNQAEAWVPLLEKRIDWIDTVITAAPLMGLLGTITGMMASFQVLSEKGVNEPNAITGGVAEALIATATGLVIALFCLVAYNYLTARVKVFIYDVESVASRLVEIRLATQRAKSKS
jgi:biopolymer transport protein ExbB